MKKILLAFDGINFSEGAFEFARQLNEAEKILLTGVFLPQVDYSSLWSYSVSNSQGPLFIPLVEAADEVKIKQNIRRFEDLCVKNNIEFRIHKDFMDFALPELKKETRFADLVILGSESFYENLGVSEPNEYLKDALHAAECPVLVVPEKFIFPQTNILAYDGSESSVYAIKQFCYLFPALCDNKTIMVNVDRKGSIPYQEYIEELAARHFRNLNILELHVDPKKYFAVWMNEKKGAMLVSGAYSKSSLAQLFHKSFVSEVIKEHRLPVFIAHK